ncbi:MAG: SDR family NAD(P)-dependent oxidoreductase [Propionibacteriaceae bacterium]|nr:SDR family NAD(P)-dependent oxidoreductase [Propionibacteriaceae bacterium]
MSTSFASRYGPWTLVTGASKGLGAEFCRQLAASGLNIVMVASHEDALLDESAAIERQYGVKTRPITLDLADDGSITRLGRLTADLDITLLVSNAAMSDVGPFLKATPEYLENQVRVNALACTLLARHYGALMAKQRRGGIILMSSGTAQHGTPYSANYAATKAFNLILAESLWYEFRPHKVDVLGVMAGATRTEGWLANHPKPNWRVPIMGVKPVVAAALRALGRRPRVSPGIMNHLGYAALSWKTRGRAVKSVGASMEKMFGPYA